jgi:hypothetical protein
VTEEERVLKEKAAVEAMRNAKANMTEALARIETLERTLHSAISYTKGLQDYIPRNCYPYRGEQTIQANITDTVAKWSAVL